MDDLLGNPNGLFQRAARLDSASTNVPGGQLGLGCCRPNPSASSSISPPPSRFWAGSIRRPFRGIRIGKRARLLYRAQASQHAWPAALASATNLVQIARLGQGDIWATNLAEGVACQARALENLGRWEEASAAWQVNFTNTAPVESQRQAVLKLADLADRLNQNPEAEARLEEYLARFPHAPAAAAAPLALGELHLKDYIAQPGSTNALAAAQASFQQFFAGASRMSAYGEGGLGLGCGATGWPAQTAGGERGHQYHDAETGGQSGGF